MGYLRMSDSFTSTRHVFYCFPHIPNPYFKKGLTKLTKRRIEKDDLHWSTSLKLHTVFTDDEIYQWGQQRNIRIFTYFLHLMIHEQPLCDSLRVLNSEKKLQKFIPFFWNFMKQWICQGGTYVHILVCSLHPYFFFFFFYPFSIYFRITKIHF